MICANIRNTNVGDEVIAHREFFGVGLERIICDTPMRIVKITATTMQGEIVDDRTRVVFYRHTSYYGTYYADTWKKNSSQFGVLIRKGA